MANVGYWQNCASIVNNSKPVSPSALEQTNAFLSSLERFILPPAIPKISLRSFQFYLRKHSQLISQFHRNHPTLVEFKSDESRLLIEKQLLERLREVPKMFFLPEFTIHSAMVLDINKLEAFNQHADTVELNLLHRMLSRKETFFKSFQSLEDVQVQVKNVIEDINGLKEHFKNSVRPNLVTKITSMRRLKIKRDSMAQTRDILKKIASLANLKQDVLNLIQEDLFSEALQSITSAQKLLDNELSKVACLRSLRGFLLWATNEIAERLHSRFLDNVSTFDIGDDENNTDSISEDQDNLIGAGKHGEIDKFNNDKSESLRDGTWVMSFVASDRMAVFTNLIQNLLFIGELDTVFETYKDRVNQDLKDLVKNSISNAIVIAGEPERPVSQGELREMTPVAFETALRFTTSQLLRHLWRIANVHDAVTCVLYQLQPVRSSLLNEEFMMSGALQSQSKKVAEDTSLTTIPEAKTPNSISIDGHLDSKGTLRRRSNLSLQQDISCLPFAADDSEFENLDDGGNISIGHENKENEINNSNNDDNNNNNNNSNNSNNSPESHHESIPPASRSLSNPSEHSQNSRNDDKSPISLPPPLIASKIIDDTVNGSLKPVILSDQTSLPHHQHSSFAPADIVPSQLETFDPSDSQNLEFLGSFEPMTPNDHDPAQIRISEDEHDQYCASSEKLLMGSCKLAQKLVANILSVRKSVHTKGTLKNLNSLTNITRDFTQSMRSPQPLNLLEDEMNKQADNYLHELHHTQQKALESIINSDDWRPATLDIRDQMLITELVSFSFNANSQQQQQHKETKQNGNGRTKTQRLHLRLVDRKYPVCSSLPHVLRMLRGYFVLLDTYPRLAPQIIRRTCELFGEFNAHSRRLVLNADAKKRNKVKRITAKHLALVIQCLSLLSDCIPHIKRGISHKINFISHTSRFDIAPAVSKTHHHSNHEQNNNTNNRLHSSEVTSLRLLDKVRQDLSTHSSEIINKLASMVTVPAQKLFSIAKTLPWNNTDWSDSVKCFSETSKSIHLLHKVLEPFLTDDECNSVFQKIIEDYTTLIQTNFDAEWVTELSQHGKERLRDESQAVTSALKCALSSSVASKSLFRIECFFSDLYLQSDSS
eukprot:TRINITY_DN991_c3_g1_i1.p1 TRINITY_DN991_c3_g1~~TRINITY_DN991_c3_g1_i1.p1  ORF type:complete len:1109 (+),score=238.83 TRINITY_DN991_c3_g1_i1:151-3477(+)